MKIEVQLLFPMSMECQEETKGGSSEKRKYSYRLEDIKAVNSYRAQGNVLKKNPISTICFILAGVLGLFGFIFIIVMATSEKVNTGIGLNIGLSVCIIGAVILCGAATLIHMKNDTSMYLVVEIETVAVEKHQLIKASRLIEGSRECDIKRGIILPVNNFSVQFINEIDNAIIKAQIENRETREVKTGTVKTKTTKSRKKSVDNN